MAILHSSDSVLAHLNQIERCLVEAVTTVVGDDIDVFHVGRSEFAAEIQAVNANCHTRLNFKAYRSAMKSGAGVRHGAL